MSIQKERYESIIHKALSQVLFESKEDLKDISITMVELTRDFSQAKIYYSTFYKKESAEFRLKDNYKTIRMTLAKKLQFRKVPELIFVFDSSLEYGNKIEKILKDII